ncbi:electron transport complex subunit RsxB [Paraferrimonas sp. SM1919]|uniref:electron transport complex subunit RsxB n=1 Tax=Paraferrimonas sp. SM1919 TaxID=2662263 RepID=UPI0013D4B315|nr:electron transport complex subunit RsxB [Paraferrimonas sp. SM1919]
MLSTIVLAITVLATIALLFGGILGYASIKFKVEGDPLVEQLDSLLPQTQCGQCGYPGCKPYAEAIANGDAINKCPPGGEATMEKIAELMGVEPQPVAAEAKDPQKKVAVIIEELCIGCTKCIQACPVDAIVGTGKMMHTVIEKDCTGCDLCVAPCPVDCIEMRPVKATVNNWDWNLQKIDIKVVEDER